jgi:uncharacterized membrane protein
MEQDNTDKSIDSVKWYLYIGIALVIFSPIILTRMAPIEAFNFSSTGQIGDTIGGITAPIVNLIGAVLVFYALKAQIKANKIVQDQLDKDRAERELEKETENLNMLYAYLSESVNNFKFTTFDEGLTSHYSAAISTSKDLEEVDTAHLTEVSGSQAFQRFWEQIICGYHSPMDYLLKEPSVGEVSSILSILIELLDRIDNSKINNREILMTLLTHQFNYRIIHTIMHKPDSELEIKFCSECNAEHGVPDTIFKKIQFIKSKLVPKSL